MDTDGVDSNVSEDIDLVNACGLCPGERDAFANSYTDFTSDEFLVVCENYFHTYLEPSVTTPPSSQPEQPSPQEAPSPSAIQEPEPTEAPVPAKVPEEGPTPSPSPDESGQRSINVNTSSIIIAILCLLRMQVDA